jgi:hypothetical protein
MKLRQMIPALALAMIPYARALDITGNVLTKVLAPIAGAKVCLKSTPTQCVTTDALGAFHITDGTIGVRAPSIMQRGDGFSLEFGGNALSLSSPVAAKARMDWTDAGGRVVSAARDLNLAQGRNMLALPDGMRKDGLYFVRVYVRDLTLTWKAVSMGAAGSTTRLDGKSSGRPAGGGTLALSKVSAAPGALEISKAGYNTSTYQPETDSATDVVIILTATSDVGVTFNSSQKIKVISIDRTKHQIITEVVNLSCDSNVVVKDTSRDTSLYAVSNGKFYLWTDGDCTGQLLNGTGTDPVGNWTISEPQVDLPAEFKGPDCSDSSGSGGGFFTSFTGSYKVTETEIDANVDIGVCPGDLYVASLLSLMDSTVQLTANTCMGATFKNDKNETATLAFTKKGDSLNADFAYKTKTCSLAQSFDFSNSTITCPEDDGTGTTSFFICIAGSGFSNSSLIGGLKRTAANPMVTPVLPMSMEKPWFGSKDIAGIKGFRDLKASVLKPAQIKLPFGSWRLPLRR